MDRNEGFTPYYNQQMCLLIEVLEMVHKTDVSERFQCCWMARHFHSCTEHTAVFKQH